MFTIFISNVNQRLLDNYKIITTQFMRPKGTNIFISYFHRYFDFKSFSFLKFFFDCFLSLTVMSKKLLFLTNDKRKKNKNHQNIFSYLYLCNYIKKNCVFAKFWVVENQQIKRINSLSSLKKIVGLSKVRFNDLFLQNITFLSLFIMGI